MFKLNEGKEAEQIAQVVREAEKNYVIQVNDLLALDVFTNKGELLAALHFMKLWTFFLWPNKFTLRTDHRALKWIHSMEQPPSLLIQWMETLVSYNFDVEFRNGTAHGKADTLSRIQHVDADGKTIAVQNLHEAVTKY